MQAYYMTEMSFPHYPLEVEQELDSRQVVVPSSYCDPKVASELYKRYLDEFEYADEMGLNLFVNEHHQNTGCLDSVAPLSLAILARNTKKAKLLILGFPLAHRDNPMRVAEEAAYIDCLSGGRLECGFVRGIPSEIHAANTNPVHTKERLDEAHDLIMKAWTHHEPFNWEGKHWQFRYANPWPRPLQQPHPPIWIAAGSKGSIPWIAERGYTVGMFLLPQDQVKEMVELYKDYCKTHGLPEPGPEKFAYLALVGVGETEEEGRRRCALVNWYLEGRRPMKFWNLPGYIPAEGRAHMAMKEGRESYEGHLKAMTETRSDVPKVKMKSVGGHVEGSSVEEGKKNHQTIYGTPDSVVEQITDFQKNTGVGKLLMMMHGGFMEHDDVMASIKLFSEEVYPGIKHLGESKVSST